MRATLAVVAMMLAGCHASCPTTIPDVVRVAVPQYVPVPDELTAPCPIAMPEARTVAEAVRIARMRRAALEACNDRLSRIRELGQ